MEKPFSIQWPLTAEQVESINRMFQELYERTSTQDDKPPATLVTVAASRIVHGR